MSSFFVFQVVTTFGCTFPSSEIIGPWSPSSVKRKRTDSVEEVRHLRSCVSNGTSECRKPSSQKVQKKYRCEWNKCSTMKLQMEHWWRPWILKKLESFFVLQSSIFDFSWHERRVWNLWGYFSLGCTLAIQIFAPVIAMTSILFLVMGDMTAALIGRSFGQSVCSMKIGPDRKKSVEGSAAMCLRRMVRMVELGGSTWWLCRCTMLWEVGTVNGSVLLRIDIYVSHTHTQNHDFDF